MIRNDLVQKGVISKLKADVSLITWLTTLAAQNEIREAQWQGRTFVYPAVRIQVGTQTEIGDPPCFSKCNFTVYSFTEKDSSQQADELSNLIDVALIRKKLSPGSGDGFTTGIVIAEGSVKATRRGERIWQAVNTYSVNLYGGFLHG